MSLCVCCVCVCVCVCLGTYLRVRPWVYPHGVHHCVACLLVIETDINRPTQLNLQRAITPATTHTRTPALRMHWLRECVLGHCDLAKTGLRTVWANRVGTPVPLLYAASRCGNVWAGLRTER